MPLGALRHAHANVWERGSPDARAALLQAKSWSRMGVPMIAFYKLPSGHLRVLHNTAGPALPIFHLQKVVEPHLSAGVGVSVQHGSPADVLVSALGSVAGTVTLADIVRLEVDALRAVGVTHGPGETSARAALSRLRGLVLSFSAEASTPAADRFPALRDLPHLLRFLASTAESNFPPAMLRVACTFFCQVADEAAAGGAM